MKKINQKKMDMVFAKVDKGIWEHEKFMVIEAVKDIAKGVVIALWTVTVFPFILLWIFITDKRR